MIKDFIILILSNNDIPTLAQNLGLGLITVLIPVAIFIFGDTEFEELDKHVLLDHIIQAKYILIYIGLMFIPMFPWERSNLGQRFVSLILWCIGLSCMISILTLAYKWAKGEKFSLRFDFLKRMTNKKDMEESWASVWSSEKVNPGNEDKFFTIFAQRIDELLKNNE